MARLVKLQWTELQREIAALAQEGKNFDALVEKGYTKSLVSKVLTALKAGKKPPQEGESKDENREHSPKKTEFSGSQSEKTEALAGAQHLRFVPKIYTTDYSPIIRAAQDAATEFWGWPKGMPLGDFLDTALHFLFKEHGITLAGYTISDEAREVLEVEAQRTKVPQEVAE